MGHRNQGIGTTEIGDWKTGTTGIKGLEHWKMSIGTLGNGELENCKTAMGTLETGVWNLGTLAIGTLENRGMENCLRYRPLRRLSAKNVVPSGNVGGSSGGLGGSGGSGSSQTVSSTVEQTSLVTVVYFDS